jgi:hypothetical protein
MQFLAKRDGGQGFTLFSFSLPDIAKSFRLKRFSLCSQRKNVSKG